MSEMYTSKRNVDAPMSHFRDGHDRPDAALMLFYSMVPKRKTADDSLDE